MSGHIARTGFLFQDLYLLFRVLGVASESLDLAWKTGGERILDLLTDLPIQFGIEASLRANGSADWDVLVLTKEKLEFAEVKSGPVTKEDRTIFWRRLRRELAGRANNASQLTPILVVDPEKVGALTKWEKLARCATSFSGVPPIQEPLGNVSTGEQLLKEALWCICRPDETAEKSDPPVPFEEALSALTRFEVHRLVAAQLDSKVSQLLELLFPNGLTNTQQALLLGWLNQRATSQNSARRLFSVRDLLGEIGILQHAMSLLPGTLKMWRDLWNDVPQGVLARTRSCLGHHGQSLPAEKVQPDALNAFWDAKNAGIILLGQGGIGKSAFIAQIAEAARHHGEEVLHCGADDLSTDELERVSDAVRFRAALLLCLRPTSKLFLCVDGLDEADPPLRKRWAEILVRLRGRSNVRLLASMRDAIWRSDGDVRRKLETWRQISMKLWPEDLVRELLKSVSFETFLPPSVVEFLRTPILLDLFWRTFIESATPDMSQVARLQTRHNLLAAFWHERLLASARHANVSDIGSHLNSVVSLAGRSVAGFPDVNLDPIGLQILSSEGVIVREGRLQPRFRFRHPLLRDFALAQWCLENGILSKVAHRWGLINGGLQRHGALRALIEALSDRDAPAEYPQLALGDVVQAIVQANPAYANQVAQVLGTRVAIAALDPAQWPPNVQSSLPPEFSRDLLSFARLEGNGSWASRVAHWPNAAAWLNKDYPKELWNYAVALSQNEARKKGLEVQDQYRKVARKLRELSEAAEFSSEFGDSERLLKMETMLCVIPVLPDEATLAWVEREMLQPSWRTRSFVLEKLIHLASADPARTAMVYRQAVGLTQCDGRPVIDSIRWSDIMDHQAIDWSLAGKDGKRSLLREYPVAFLPVALDLAEALWTGTREDLRITPNIPGDRIRQLDPSWSKEAEEARERERQLTLGDLIDDSPNWYYWGSISTNDPYERCLKAIHESLEHHADSDAQQFTVTLLPISQVSRLASIHSILLDIMLHRKSIASFDFFRLEILDVRLYHASGLAYWLEEALVETWARLGGDDRAIIFDHLRGLLTGPESETDGERFLARLPAEDLPIDLQSRRRADDDESFRPTRRPSSSEFDPNSERTVLQSDDKTIDVGRWPEDFDETALSELASVERELAKNDVSEPENVLKALKAAERLLPHLQRHLELLHDRRRFWVWRAFTQMLNRFSLSEFTNDTTFPQASVVSGCAALALSVVENVPSDLPGELPEGGLWSGHRESAWENALRLADAALMWRPVADDTAIQARFAQSLESAFETGNPVIQLTCTAFVRSWHWLRTPDRRQLHDRLIWNTPKHASVLAWSLSRIQTMADSDQGRIFRLLLNRADIVDSKYFAHRLGHCVGGLSMHLFNSGQRSSVAELAREVVAAPEDFSLLQKTENFSAFSLGFVFGMKESAKLRADHSELADDYGEWALKTWRKVRQTSHGSEDIVLQAMHWLEKNSFPHNRLQLVAWWRRLLPLFAAVVLEGRTPDCFTLFFNLRDGSYNDLASPTELIGLVEAFAERLISGANDRTVNLDARSRENGGYNSWRKCAGYAAEVIESLRRDGSLPTEFDKEKAHRMLSLLAAEPLRILAAIEALHRLQNE